MIHKISRFADDRLVVSRNGRQGELDAFFADFLSDAGQSLLDQFRGVAAGRRIGDALGMICSSLPKNSRRCASERGASAPQQVSVPR